MCILKLMLYNYITVRGAKQKNLLAQCTIHTHSRSEYVAIKVTSSVPTRTDEHDVTLAK